MRIKDYFIDSSFLSLTVSQVLGSYILGSQVLSPWVSGRRSQGSWVPDAHFRICPLKVLIENTHLLPQNPLQDVLVISHLFQASEITAKYEKWVKYLWILHEITVR